MIRKIYSTSYLKRTLRRQHCAVLFSSSSGLKNPIMMMMTTLNRLISKQFWKAIWMIYIVPNHILIVCYWPIAKQIQWQGKNKRNISFCFREIPVLLSMTWQGIFPWPCGLQGICLVKSLREEQVFHSTERNIALISITQMYYISKARISSKSVSTYLSYNLLTCISQKTTSRLMG